jgi:hypothetical protein
LVALLQGNEAAVSHLDLRHMKTKGTLDHFPSKLGNLRILKTRTSSSLPWEKMDCPKLESLVLVQKKVKDADESGSALHSFIKYLQQPKKVEKIMESFIQRVNSSCSLKRLEICGSVGIREKFLKKLLLNNKLEYLVLNDQLQILKLVESIHAPHSLRWVHFARNKKKPRFHENLFLDFWTFP